MNERVTAGGDGVWALPLPAGLTGGQPIHVRARQTRDGAPSGWSASVIVTPSLADVAEIDAAWAWAAAEGLSGQAARARVAGLLATSYGIMALIVGRGLAGATAGADFRLRRYWLPAPADPTAPAEVSEAVFFAQYTAASTSTRTYFDAAGVLRADLAANQPRFSYLGGSRRLVLENALTNKVFGRKHNPVDLSQLSKGGDAAAVLSVVDDSAALVAGGLGAICTSGTVYQLDNTAGTTEAIMGFSGPTGNVNPHCVQAWMRGSGTVSLRLADNTSAVSVPLTTAWAQYQSAAGVPTATNMTMRAIVPAGGVLYLILPGLYEAATAPHAPIIGDTIAQVTRVAEMCRLPAGMEAVLQGAAGTGLVQALPPRAGTSSTDVPVLLGGPVHPLIGLRSATAVRTMLDGAAVLDAVPGANILANGLGAAFAWDASGAVACANGGAVASSATSILPGIRSSAWLGRAGGGGYAKGDGLYDLVAMWPGRIANAAVQAAAVPYAP
ncbi:hypothetical protein SAMN02745172_02451 [Pseudoxanthobacter soli DSM 19599]|uniref:Uncharacterized protein n=1 Tax=Pseudoxanthobacter soli DSM 19599 TaxID=1123029 RepID=A0A1M7ZLN2_9HYPH|nr:hypothetical protein [Pseudoxanthobacter soli]SHO65804.1 hypothetical protein SAMN02745172_02451 [Pseudoxanthobacter soli DSM 19599]